MSKEAGTVSNVIERQLEEITSHPALANAFYREWMALKFDIEALELFARNYGAWVKSFPDALATLVRATDDLDAKGEYVKTLYSEMGYGHRDKVHWVLLDAFLAQLATKMGRPGRLDRDRLEREVTLLPSTRALIDGEQELYALSDVAFGAQLALEWQAYTMVRQLYEGARQYLALWSNPDEFHEAAEYFYVHIGAAEKAHKDESLNAMRRYARDEERIKRGYGRHLDLIAGFWNGLHESTHGLAS